MIPKVFLKKFNGEWGLWVIVHNIGYLAYTCNSYQGIRDSKLRIERPELGYNNEELMGWHNLYHYGITAEVK
jgi:hypothetical protein